MCIRDRDYRDPHAALVLFRLVALLYRVFHLPLRQGSRGHSFVNNVTALNEGGPRKVLPRRPRVHEQDVGRGAHRAAGAGIKTTAGGRQCTTSKRFQL